MAQRSLFVGGGGGVNAACLAVYEYFITLLFLCFTSKLVMKRYSSATEKGGTKLSKHSQCDKLCPFEFCATLLKSSMLSKSSERLRWRALWEVHIIWVHSRRKYEGWNFNFGNTPPDWMQELLEWRANAAERMGPSPTYILNGSGPSRNGHTQ